MENVYYRVVNCRYMYSHYGEAFENLGFKNKKVNQTIKTGHIGKMFGTFMTSSGHTAIAIRNRYGEGLFGLTSLEKIEYSEYRKEIDSYMYDFLSSPLKRPYEDLSPPQGVSAPSDGLPEIPLVGTDSNPMTLADITSPKQLINTELTERVTTNCFYGVFDASNPPALNIDLEDKIDFDNPAVRLLKKYV